METEVLKPLEGLSIPDDTYYVTVRFNEANLEELGLIYLHGAHNHVRIDLVNAHYLQALDLAPAGESHSLHADYPEVIYQVENSSLITNLDHVTQGIMYGSMEGETSEVQDCYSHYKIILDKLFIDLVRDNYVNLPPIVKVEEVDDGKSN